MKKSKTPVTAENFCGHLSTVCKHRYLVMKGCFRVGLYRQGLLHDLSKFSPTEFMVGVRYWQGTRSPNNAEREEKVTARPGFITKGETATILNTGWTTIPGVKWERIR